MKPQVVHICRMGSAQAICLLRRDPKEFAQVDASLKFLKGIEPPAQGSLMGATVWSNSIILRAFW